MSLRYDVNLFNGDPIPSDTTLTPSDGSIPGTSEIISGIADDTDVVVSFRNTAGANLQGYWAQNKLPYEWDAIGAPTALTQQTPIRLRKGFSYRFETDAGGVELYLNRSPASIEYDEKTGQVLR